jgi:transcription elongation GreA/GreB family factor
MDKRKLVEEIQRSLALELHEIMQAAEASRQAATHEESKPEDQYDTRGLEASYLAGAQAQRVADIQKQILVYRFLPIREYGQQDVIAPGALVEMKLNERSAYYFLVPQAGGMVMRQDGRAVQVITPQSPLGDAILGKKVGDLVEVEVGAGTREYEIVSLQ